MSLPLAAIISYVNWGLFLATYPLTLLWSLSTLLLLADWITAVWSWWVCQRATWTNWAPWPVFRSALEGLSQLCSCFSIICGMYCTGSLSHNASLIGLLFWSGGASLAVPRPIGVIFVVCFVIHLQPSSLTIFCWGRTFSPSGSHLN